MNKILNLFIGGLLIANLWGEGLVINGVQEVDGKDMPGWEKDVIKRFGGKPVVFRGGAKDWEAMEWTLESLVERFGGMDVDTHLTNEFEYILGVDEWGDFTVAGGRPYRVKLREHVESIVKAPETANYLGIRWGNFTVPEGVGPEECFFGEKGECWDEDDATANAYLGMKLELSESTHYPHTLDSEGGFYSVYIGSDRSVAALHNHGAVFIGQYLGSKVVSLVEERNRSKCGCLDLDARFVDRCDLDVMSPDFDKFPEAKGLEVYQVVLKAGDVLYIPTGWFHDVRAIEGGPSMSISYGFIE